MTAYVSCDFVVVLEYVTHVYLRLISFVNIVTTLLPAAFVPVLPTLSIEKPWLSLLSTA